MEEGFPSGNPFLCHYTNFHNDSFVIACCREHDYCNQELSPTLHSREASGRYSAADGRSYLSRKMYKLNRCRNK